MTVLDALPSRETSDDDMAPYKMWGGVILQAARDATPRVWPEDDKERRRGESGRTYDGRMNQRKEAGLRKDQAVSWFRGRYFQHICALCGADSDGVIAELRKDGFSV